MVFQKANSEIAYISSLPQWAWKFGPDEIHVNEKDSEAVGKLFLQ